MKRMVPKTSNCGEKAELLQSCHRACKKYAKRTHFFHHISRGSGAPIIRRAQNLPRRTQSITVALVYTRRGRPRSKPESTTAQQTVRTAGAKRCVRFPGSGMVESGGNHRGRDLSREIRRRATSMELPFSLSYHAIEFQFTGKSEESRLYTGI